MKRSSGGQKKSVPQPIVRAGGSGGGGGGVGGGALKASSSGAVQLPAVTPSKAPFRSYAHDTLAALLHPISVETFFNDYWEKKPLVVNRRNAQYYERVFGSADAPLFTKAALDEALRAERVRFGEHLSVVKYNKSSGEKEEFNRPFGEQAKFADVDRRWQQGCTLQVRLGALVVLACRRA